MDEDPLLLELLELLPVQLPGVPNSEGQVCPELQLSTPSHAPELHALVVMFVTQMLVPDE